MNKNSSKRDKKGNMLLRIANHLIMHTSSMTDLGLYHGKMGIVIFFAHYAKYTEEAMYDEFTGYLLDEIVEEIHVDIPINFESGLSGIGWGVEHLVKNKFCKGDTDEILADIDNKLMEYNLRRISDRSVRTGSEGLIYYIDKRMICSPHKKFDASFIDDFQYVKKKYKINIPGEKDIISSIYGISPKGNDITEWKCGLENGCAGYGLKLLLR